MGHDMAAVEEVLAEQNAVLAGYHDLPPVSNPYRIDHNMHRFSDLEIRT